MKLLEKISNYDMEHREFQRDRERHRRASHGDYSGLKPFAKQRERERESERERERERENERGVSSRPLLAVWKKGGGQALECVSSLN